MSGIPSLIRISAERGSPGPSQELNRFLDRHFPELGLGPPLFYSWPIGLRFELGGNVQGDRRVEQALARATRIYEEVFASTDDALIEAALWPPFTEEAVPLFDLVPADAQLSFEPGGLDESFSDDDELPLIQLVIRAGPREIDYSSLLRQLINFELGKHPSTPWDVFILNLTAPQIYYLYDDRGLDVVAEQVDTLRPIYEKFGDLILDYDRERIRKMFEPH